MLHEAVEGFITGMNRRQERESRNWKTHILAATDGSGRNTVVNYFARIEFQDGKRKRKRGKHQGYHGRGTLHVHLLVWIEHGDAIAWSDIVSAETPQNNLPLRSLVLGSQVSYTGSGWDVREEATKWDKGSGCLLLRHPAADHKAGVRAYMPDVLAATKCHMDVVASDGRGMLLRYVAGYVPKFSDSFAQGWLNDKASAYAISRRVLNDYHPLEHEMWLQLAAQFFPQCFHGGTRERYVVPTPWTKDPDAAMLRYMACEWRSESMSFLQFLRKSNLRGGIHNAFQKRHKVEAPNDNLHSWIHEVKPRGEKLIAAITLSRYDDRYYGQWLLLNVPFRHLDELLPECSNLIPEQYRYLGVCLLNAPHHWRDLSKVKMELERHAYKDTYVKSILAMVDAQTKVVDDFLCGKLVIGVDDVPIVGRAPPRAGAYGSLWPEQNEVVQMINWRVQSAMKATWAAEQMAEGQDVAAGQLEEIYKEDMRAIAILGPAGSGKTFAIEIALRDAIAAGARTIVACPTGLLATTFRQKFPDQDVDTIHGAFLLHRPEHETLDLMSGYDLIIIEEVGQLSAAMFERLMRLWEATQRRPALVFVGDFAQLKGVEGTRALNSWQWDSVRKKRLLIMRRCECEDLRWKLELLRDYKPSRSQWKAITRGHCAIPLHMRVYRDLSLGPTLEDIAHIFTKTPHTMFLTCTRAASAKVNMMALQHYFSNIEPLGYVPTDPDSNPANFNDRGTQIGWAPLQMPVFVGARVMLTQNLHKKFDYVNGMEAEVVGYVQNAVRVRTKTGRFHVIAPWTNDEGNTYLPMRLAYACTLHKMQGATLRHLTLWLDMKDMEAAGYVALSRVKKDVDWQYVGDPGVHHFKPAEGF